MHRFQSSIILVRNLSFSSQWEDTVCEGGGGMARHLQQSNQVGEV